MFEKEAFMKKLCLLAAIIPAVLIVTGFMWGCNATTSNIRKNSPAFHYDGKQALTVVSFNIRVGYGTEDIYTGPYDLKNHKKSLTPIVEAIRSCDADIAGLQEVLANGQALELARRLNMNVAFAGHPTASPYGPWWGVALLSRYPIVNSEGFTISTGRGNGKTALLCTVDVGGRMQHFISVHKDKDLKDGGSFKNIMKKIETIDGPAVLIGDLNMQPYDMRLKILKPRLVDSARTVDTPTVREARKLGTFYGIGRIDYILVDPNFYTVADAGLAEDRYRDASDHLAYWAQIIPRP